MLVSPNLPLFSEKKEGLWIWRCHVCGDSQKNKHRKRAYAFVAEQEIVLYCHNCGWTSSVRDLVKHLNPTLYGEYTREKFQFSNLHVEKKPVEETPKVDLSVFDSLKNVGDFPPFHPVVKYLKKRKIPSDKFNLFYYAANFPKFVNSVVPGKITPEIKEPRLVIPFIKNNKVVAFQGRSFDPRNELRYITITLDDTQDKVFGYDLVDKKKDVFVVEGPINSLFLPNAVAVGGSNIITLLRNLEISKERLICVFDNEPRNPQIVKKLEKVIDAGYRVCIWPKTLDEKDDINDLVKKNINVFDVISQSIYKGLDAKLRFMSWRKV